MLSLDRCRKLLGPDVDLSDDELTRILTQLYAVADVALDQVLMPRAATDKAGPTRPRPFEATLRLVSDAERESLEERAAIQEYDGGLSRRDAERATLAALAKAKRKDGSR